MISTRASSTSPCSIEMDVDPGVAFNAGHGLDGDDLGHAALLGGSWWRAVARVSFVQRSEKVVGAAEAEERFPVDNRCGGPRRWLGQGVHQVEQRVAAGADRSIAAPAGNPARTQSGGPLPPQPPAVTGPMHISPCSSRQRILDSGSSPDCRRRCQETVSRCRSGSYPPGWQDRSRRRFFPVCLCSWWLRMASRASAICCGFGGQPGRLRSTFTFSSML